MEEIIVLLIGDGGREHALIRKFLESPLMPKALCHLYAVTANPGICHDAHSISVTPDDLPNLLRFAKDIARQGRLLTVVGPEAPLAAGMVDAFRENGLAIIGPTQAAARIETDKAFALELMRRHKIPTGRFRVFNRTVFGMYLAQTYALAACERKGRVVVKPNGLTAGKGVRICGGFEEVNIAISDIMLNRVYGPAGDKAVVMEHLGDGEEFSVFALVDKAGHIAMLGAAQDHKRLLDGDQGPNTGGMGAYSPVPFVNDALMSEVRERIIEPMVQAMAKNGTPYTGFLYAGLIMTPVGPKVIEWNCRLGDPEAQVVLPLLKTDFLKLLFAAEAGNLDEVEVEFHDGAATCVVLASRGYPDKTETGFPISGIEAAEALGDVFVFHAGTKIAARGELITAGGRVVGVTALDASLPDSIAKAYVAVELIKFEGRQYRPDIGHRVLQ